MAPGTALLILKILVATVTLLLAASLVALALGRPRWHGRINTVFFILTVTTLIGFEILIRLIYPNLTAGFSPEQREALSVHLRFSVPSAILLPIMLFTGLRKYKKAHRTVAVGFLILWIGTFITGVFFLPHTIEPRL